MKTWHWLALAAGGYFVFRDNIHSALLPESFKHPDVTLKAGHRYKLFGPDVNIPAIERSNIIIPITDQVIKLGSSVMPDAGGQPFRVSIVEETPIPFPGFIPGVGF